MNIFILDKNYNQIGILSNEGANPQAPYFDDLYTQELDTGADTFYFTTLSTSASRDFIEIGNHIIFQFNNRHRLFAISDLEFEHKEGRNVIGVYAEGVGFQLLETFMGEFEGGDDTNGDGKVDKEDEGEGEFMTYDMFLEKVLKDTDWNYQIMSGDLTNINMGKEVRFSNGKNIYALLQDSMQEFGGVELEFRAEYVGGGLNKTIYAYPHKGRGSFVGQRFEYGHNVAGIKKKQEVVDYMDKNIILYEGLETVDGLNVEVTYEVDFALRSYEVEELEIGDTHYVIDNDFEPAQFEARIGKIEISFSDPTKNKCYIANFKKISGSTPDNVTGDNIEDVVDDKLDELIDDKLDELLGDGFKNHTHDRLVSENDGSKTPLVFKSGHGFMADNNSKWHMAHLVNSDIGLNFGATDAPDHWTSVYIERSSSLANGAKATATIFTSDGNMLPDTNNQYIGSPNRRWEATYSNYINAADSVDSPRYFGYNYQVRFDRDDMQNVTKVTDKQDLLDFIMNKVNVYTYSSKTIDDVVGAPDKMPYQEYYGLLAEDFTTHNSSTDCGGSEVAYNIMKNLLTDDTNGDGELNKNDGHNKHSYNLPALVTTLIGAFQQHVENGDDGGGDHSKCAEKAWVEEWCSNLELADKEMDKRLDALEAGGSENPGGGISDTVENLTVTNVLKVDKIRETTFNAGITFDDRVFSKDGLEVSGNPSFIYDGLYVKKILSVGNGNLKVTNGDLNVNGNATVKQLFCDSISIKGNVSNDTLRCKELILEGNLLDPEATPDNASIKFMVDRYSSQILGSQWIEVDQTVYVKDNLVVDGAILGADSLEEIDFLDAKEAVIFKISGDLYETTQGQYNRVEFEDGICVTHIWGNKNTGVVDFGAQTYVSMHNDLTIKGNLRVNGTISKNSQNYSDDSLKENIHYLDSATTPDVGEGDYPDFLEKADLYDFIVNQINLCEFNYIGDTAEKIGFIANEYEGTKVGDKIVSPYEIKERDDNGEIIGTTETLVYDTNNLLFATIGALQEEVRIKDEKIASLEARLARLEEMLGINNNN